jgi:N-acetylneuraminic acid mutarotase
MPCFVRPFSPIARCLVLAAVAVVIAVLVLPPLPAQGVSSATTRLDWGTKAPMPTPRTGLGVVAASNGRLYAVGGANSSGSSLSTVEEYDPATNTWATKASMQARRSLGVAALPNGKLYAVGGANSSGSPLSTVEEYDLATNVWTPKAPMPTSRSELGLAVGANGKLYAIGGTNGSPLQTVEEYDPATNTWRGAAHGLAPMPTARRSLGLVAASNGKLYAIGGVSPTCPGSQCAAVEEYDPATNTWRGAAQGLTPMPTAREALGLSAAPNGRIYAIGGFKTGGGCPTAADCAVVEEYDPATNRWRGFADGLALMPTNRSSLGLATAPNGRLYAIGGFNSVGTHNEVEEYDPGTNSWASKPARAPLPGIARHRAAVAVANERIYVIGGADGSGNPLNEVWQYDPATNAWDQKADMPTRRFGPAAATAPNGRIYVVGGEGSTGYLALLEEFTPPSNGVGPGSWQGDPQIAQPAIQRTSLGFVLASNGRLYAVGGFGTDPRLPPSFRERSEVEEFRPVADPLAGVFGVWRDVTSMSRIREALGVAASGDHLYAVAGHFAGSLDSIERFAPPAGSFSTGSWTGPDGLANLPAPREYLGLVGAPNGNLYAIGGMILPSDPAVRHRAEVFEYDPNANDWTTKAPMPTPRRGMSVALVGKRLFAIAGFNGLALDVNEEAVLDALPTVSAGGPYNAPAGGAVSLGATGSDPDGDPLSYAWDINGDLVYETAGQSPTASTAGVAPGVHTIRVRALDPAGGYSLATATLTLSGPERLAFSTHPVGGPPGTPLATQPVVQALDGQGRLVPWFTGPVTMALGTNPGGGSLGGTVTVNAVNGVATFSNLSVPTSASGYTLVATAPGLASATSGPFMVTGPCTPRPQVRVLTQPVGPGQIRATLLAGSGTLAGTLQIGSAGKPIQNATVDVQGGPSGITASQDLPVSGSEVVLTVTRREGGAVTVPLTITDGCGEWQTFVGFGPGV